jgi:hypothetical protein
VSGVGGVAFSTVAKPDPAIKDKPILLRYDKAALDGRRLRVVVEGVSDYAELPDWMLIPIAKFADSDYDACVSLFGPETSATAYDIVYHASFQNTLLGLRLLQADMMLFNIGETWRLPQRNGVVTLGAGEMAPKQMDEASALAIDAALHHDNFQSWVMTDQDEDITFSVREGRLELSGEPYYHFWTSNVEEVQAAQRRLEQQVQSLRRAGRIAESNRIVEQINAMAPTVTQVEDLTRRLKAERRALRRFNTPVYNAATQTMRYSAFFRYVKQQDQPGWRNFLYETAAVGIRPEVATPTRWAR